MTVLGMELLLSPYLLTNWIAAARDVTTWDPKTLFVLADGTYLDHAIPFVDWSILIYCTIFAFYFVLPFSAPKNDTGRRELLISVQFIVLSSWLAYLVFLFFPAKVDLRWQVHEAQAAAGWTAKLYAGFHWLDRPFNAWPCLHVSQTFLAAIAISRWWKARGLGLRVITLWILWITLTVSTLTTKQHFLWDALSGLGLGLATWWFGFRLALRPQNIFGAQNQPVQTQP
ncbi:MAG: phosphatase PAP2 family protein [Opitutales bacterium]